jgi:3-deoxy-D-manno-octulosonic-acid transferase
VGAGDTRYDQATARKAQVEADSMGLLPDELVREIEQKGTLVFVIGSAWSEDETIAQKALRASIERKDNILWIIVPHEPSNEHIGKLLSLYPNRIARLSELGNYKGQPIIVVDSVGKLFGLYQYADIAMVGGGFSQGLHNVLEPSVWGVPSIVGPNHRKSQEVQQLIDALGAFEVTNEGEFDFAFWRFVQDSDLRQSSGEKAQRFVEERRGATEEIVGEIESVLHERS